MPDRLDGLDWHVLVAALGEHARTPFGRAAITSLPLMRSIAEVRLAHDAVEELLRLEEEHGVPVPVGGIRDIRTTAKGASKGEVLDRDALREAAGTLWALRELEATLSAYSDDAPTLAAMAAEIDVPDSLVDLLDGAFDPAGELSAQRWPILQQLRSSIASLHREVRDTLDRLVGGDELAEVLQDRFVTQRRDRYVLPIKAHAKRWDLGIVHGTSNTGQTVFIEPHAVVSLNNRLKVAEGQLAAEEHRILAELSLALGAERVAIDAAVFGAEKIDRAAARAGLSRQLSATRPHVGDEGVVRLVEARHPVLVLRGVGVVANDLHLTSDQPILVLSGPNAGGKTVALKTVGLAALLVRAGCFVPAAVGSRIDVFQHVRADIGDAQTVERDLSSFSAHLTTLRDMLQHASSKCLYLLDEVAVGTDPIQGSALARAVLEALLASGPRVVVTTHYTSIKGLATADSRFAVAAMEYAKGRPTYRVIAGVAGESHALSMAAHVGLPPALIERATELMGESERGFADALVALDAQRDAAAAAEHDHRALLAHLAEREASLAVREEQLRTRTQQLAAQATDVFRRRLDRAQAAIGLVVAELQRSPSHDGVAQARASVTALAAIVDTPEPADQPAQSAIAVGDHVRVRGQRGEVVAQSGSRLQVQIGAVTLRVDQREATRVAPKAQAPRTVYRPPSGPDADPTLHHGVRTPSNTIDLRGERVEESLETLDAFLDRALLSGISEVFILHGHGTGALKSAVRQCLPGSPYVDHWAPANADQGGDAFTIVALRRA